MIERARRRTSVPGAPAAGPWGASWSIRAALLFALVLTTGSDAGAQGLPYRRWLAPKTYSCAYGVGNVLVTLSEQNTEFANLPPDATFTLNYVDNGVVTTNGPFPVEQLSGTKAYGTFGEFFPDYPLRFEFRMDTLVANQVVYQSAVVIDCSSNFAGPATIVNLAPAVGDGGFTGTWTGKWRCAVNDNGVPDRLENKTSTLAIAQNGTAFAATLDGGEQHFRGVGREDGLKPSKTRAALTECRTNGFGVAPSLSHVIDATFKAGKQPKLVATGAYLKDDGVHRVVGTCKYQYKRITADDPGVFGCVQ